MVTFDQPQLTIIPDIFSLSYTSLVLFLALSLGSSVNESVIFQETDLVMARKEDVLAIRSF